jgi:hypothetical protein
VKENINAPATLLTYLRPKIRRLLEVINSSGRVQNLEPRFYKTFIYIFVCMALFKVLGSSIFDKDWP